jgi:hypothetical protein
MAEQIRFCLVDATYYQQGIVKRPKGFSAESSGFFQRAQDDAGRIRSALGHPKEPAQGDSFLIVGTSWRRSRLVSARRGVVGGGRRGFSRHRYVLLSDPGGSRPGLRPRSSPEESRSARLRVVDSRQDAWKTASGFAARGREPRDRGLTDPGPPFLVCGMGHVGTVLGSFTLDGNDIVITGENLLVIDESEARKRIRSHAEPPHETPHILKRGATGFDWTRRATGAGGRGPTA